MTNRPGAPNEHTTETDTRRLQIQQFIMQSYHTQGVRPGMPPILETIGARYLLALAQNPDPDVPALIEETLRLFPGDHPPATELQRLIEDDFEIAQSCHATSDAIVNKYHTAMWREGVKLVLARLAREADPAETDQTQIVINAIARSATGLQRQTLEHFSEPTLTNAIINSDITADTIQEEERILRDNLPEVERIITELALEECEEQETFRMQCVQMAFEYYDVRSADAGLHPVFTRLGQLYRGALTGKAGNAIHPQALIQEAVDTAPTDEVSTPSVEDVSAAYERDTENLVTTRIVCREILDHMPDPTWPNTVKRLIIGMGRQRTITGNPEVDQALIGMGQSLKQVRRAKPLTDTTLTRLIGNVFPSLGAIDTNGLLLEIKRELITRAMKERDAHSRKPGRPPKAPKPPEKPLEVVPFPNFARIRECAGSLRDFKPLKSRPETRRQKQTQDAIDSATTDCRELAVFVSEDVPGLVHDIEEKRSCPKIEGCYIKRKKPEIISPPNIACEGHFDIKFGKKGGQPVLCRLSFEMDNDTNLSVITEDRKTHSPEAFQGSGRPSALGNMYQELRRIIIVGLAERLTIQDTAKHARFIKASSPGNPRKIPKFRTTRGFIRPNFTELDPSSSESNDRPKKPAAVTAYILDLIDKIQRADPEDPVTAEMIEPIVLYRNFPQTDEGEVTRDVYLAIDTIDALQQLASGQMSKNEVCICLNGRKNIRAGYNPRPQGQTLVCSPRSGSEETDNLRALTEKVLGFKLSDEGLKDLTTITVAPEIETVIIGTREEVRGGGGRRLIRDEINQISRYALEVIAQDPDAPAQGTARITMQEIQAMLAAEHRENELSAEAQTLVHQVFIEIATVDGVADRVRGRINHIVFNAPQNPRYSKGKFESLAEQEALLKDA